MNADAMNIGVVLAMTVVIVLVAHEIGYRLGGRALRRGRQEKEGAVSAIGAASLGLAGFMLAFAFGISFDRYNDRRELVRAEADAIRTAWMRSEFLPEPDRATSAALLKRYAEHRLEIVRARNPARFREAFAEAGSIHAKLWTMAVSNARRDMNSDVAALYIESLNDVANLHAQRVSVALHWRIPTGVWLALCALILLAMVVVGYQAAITESQRSGATWLMSVAFALVMVLIAALDRPESGLLPVTQQPIEAVSAMISAGIRTP